MKRRTTLKSIAAASVGLLAVGYWAKDLDSVKDLLSSSFLKPTEQDALTSVIDTIIPKGDQLYGAIDLGVPIYLMDYLQSCVKAEQQDLIKVQLQNIDLHSNEKYGSDFNELEQSQREEILLSLASSENAEEMDFYNLIKEQTIHGFWNSKEVLSNHYNYKVVPGEFNGCFDVETETEKII